MLKHVLALPRQTVCRNGLTIFVDDIAMGNARELDGRGRPLPVWQGCRDIGAGELFLMNWQSATRWTVGISEPSRRPPSLLAHIPFGPKRSDHALLPCQTVAPFLYKYRDLLPFPAQT